MAPGHNVVAVIPARGGSKGLPRKNILPLLGKPVLAYTIESALQASTLDRVILSTDSQEIAEVGRRFGVEVPFLRPAELATDTASTAVVLEHAISYLEEHEHYRTDLVVTLQPTSPLRLSENIDRAVDLLQQSPDLDSVVTVVEVGLPPHSVLRLQDSLLRPFLDDGEDYSLKRRQDLEQLYRPSGAVYVTRRQLLKERGLVYSAFAGGNNGYVIIDPVSSLEIDTSTDLMVIEAVLKRQG